MKTVKIVGAMVIWGAVVMLSSYTKTTEMIGMGDGTLLATDIYQPQDQGPGPWPAILIRTPYDRTRIGSIPVFKFTDMNGYAVVIQDMRGTGASTGIDSCGLDDGWGENRDGYETVEWMAEQSWCDGNVGMWGVSGPGTIQYLTAGSAPPHLKCLYPIVAVPSSYHYYIYPGGERIKRDNEEWAALQGVEYMLEAWDAHPCYDEFWARTNLAERWDSVVVPIYTIAGWYDVCIEGQLDAFSLLQAEGGEGARCNQKILIGPWTHGTGVLQAGELMYPENAALDVKAGEAIRWFDYWLKGEDNGIMDEPPVRYYQMGDPDNGITDIENVWMNADTWPLPSEPLDLYLLTDGSLDSLLPVSVDDYREYTYDPQNPVPTAGGRNIFPNSNTSRGPFDQRDIESHPGILVYTSQVLEEPVVVAGKVKAHLWASSDRLDTDWSVRLCDVYPDGRSMLVGDGILRARFCNSPAFEDEELLVPDSIYEFVVDLWSSAITFAEGHKIRVSVASSNYPRFEKNPNTGAPFKRDDYDILEATNRIYCDAQHPSYISLLIPTEEPGCITEVDNRSLVELDVSGDGVFFTVPESGFVTVEIYDVCGRQLETLLHNQVSAGVHRIDLPELSNGVYFARLEFNTSSVSTRFVLIR